MILTQKRFFMVRECETQEHGLRYRVSNLKDGSEATVPYEDILLDKLIKKQETGWVSILASLFLFVIFFVNLVALISGEGTEFTYGTLSIIFLLLLVSCISSYVLKRHEILIPTVSRNNFQQYIILFENVPKREQVDLFIKELTVHINTYLKEKYGSIDRDFPIDPQLQNLVWLKDRGAITTQEFEELKDKALGRATSSKGIGFKSNSNLEDLSAKL